jgi:NAD(P)-dependent dehydrogenase (short-subunit alcohol dehydrogenase family)
MDPKKMFDLTGKIALVTGASRGIGEAIAGTLAAYGAHVIVASRKVEDCEKVASAIRAAGGSAEALGCHIGDLDQVNQSFATITGKHKRLDILINNAATNPYFGHITNTDPAVFQKIIDVNVRGYFFMSAAAAKLMAKNGGGSIVNVASVAGRRPGPMTGIYSVTKAAVISMTECFALECAPMKVRVNALLPGATDTKLAAALVKNPEIWEKARVHIPMDRAAMPEEMAGAVLYLVSPAASYTTGTSLNVDGGYLLV